MAWQYTIRALAFNSPARDFTIFTFLGQASPSPSTRASPGCTSGPAGILWLGYRPQTALTLLFATRYRRPSRPTALLTDLLLALPQFSTTLLTGTDRLRTKRGGLAPCHLRVLLHNLSGILVSRSPANFACRSPVRIKCTQGA